MNQFGTAEKGNTMDPYKAAEDAYKEHEGMGRHQLRAAVTAALVTDRKRTLAYWLCRMRQRVIWFGGWEEANCGGWSFRIAGGRWASPTPVSVFRVFTLYGWGWQVRLPWTILVRSPEGVYFSPDGTPSRATLWLTKRPEYL
jgi:hypothetical protein